MLIMLGAALICWHVRHARNPSPTRVGAVTTDKAGDEGPPSSPSPQAQGALTMWHLTDSHLNLWHLPNGDVRDMCRSKAPTPNRRPGPFGHFNCDPTSETLRSALAVMRQAHPEPSLILLGGDVFGHVPAEHEHAKSVATSQRVQAELIAEFFPNTPVLPVLGNHDTMPYFSRAGGTAAQTTLASLFGHHLPQGALSDLRTIGYYRYTVRTPAAGQQIWILALDTNALSLTGSADAAETQLRWYSFEPCSIPHTTLVTSAGVGHDHVCASCKGVMLFSLFAT